MRERYYIHGDAHEIIDNKFYCAQCDSFEHKDHFSLSGHLIENHERYLISLKILKKSDNSRPKDSVNLFANLPKIKPKVGKFYRWLEKQKDRNDPVGDFARDAISDNNFPKDRGSVIMLRQYLITKRACDEALVTLKEAHAEFKSEKL